MIVKLLISFVFTTHIQRGRGFLFDTPSPKKTDPVTLSTTTVIPHGNKGQVPSPDYKGKEFVVALWKTYYIPRMTLLVTTTNIDIVNVHVSTPMSSSSVTQVFTISAGNVTRLQVGNGSDVVLVTADDEIIVYCMNYVYSMPDAYLALPTDVLGTEYYAVTDTPRGIYSSAIVVIGIKNSTSVSLTLPKNLGSLTVSFSGNTYGSGDTFNVSLQRFQKIQLFSSQGDLTGTYIRSNLPVAVLSGSVCELDLMGLECDHFMEMLQPVDTWGKTFITVPIPERTVGDKFRFIASEDDTSVTIQGGYNTSFALPKAGDMIQVLIPSTAYCFVSSNKALMVVQFVRGSRTSNDDGDQSILNVTPIRGYGSDFTFPTLPMIRSHLFREITIIIKEKDKNGLLIDGKYISSNFHQISGTEYVVGTIRIKDGDHTISHDSPTVKLGGYHYLIHDLDYSYAFPIGMKLEPIKAE